MSLQAMLPAISLFALAAAAVSARPLPIPAEDLAWPELPARSTHSERPLPPAPWSELPFAMPSPVEPASMVATALLHRPKPARLDVRDGMGDPGLLRQLKAPELYEKRLIDPTPWTR